MMRLQNTATKVLIAAVSKSAASTATGYVDTLAMGSEVAIDVQMDSQASTTSNPSIFKLEECEDTSVSNAVAITGLTGDATDGFTIAAANSVTPYITRLNLKLGIRKRYLHLTISPTGTTGIIAAHATFGRLRETTLGRAKMQQVVDKA